MVRDQKDLEVEEWERNVNALVTYERIWGLSENRVDTLQEQNIQSSRFISLKATVPFERIILVADSNRVSIIKPRVDCIRNREGMLNVCLHACQDHLCHAGNTFRGIPTMEIIIIPWEIMKGLPQILPISGTLLLQTPLLGRI